MTARIVVLTSVGTVGAPLAVIARRRKVQIQVFRTPGGRSHRVQIGNQWLGVAMPATITPEVYADGPSIALLIAADKLTA